MLYLFFVLIAAICWGLSGGIGAILMANGWDAYVVSFYRGVIGFLFVLTWLVLYPQKHGLGSRRLWLWSLLAGLGVAGNFTFYFISIAQGSVAVAVTLMYCAPIFVYIVSFFLKLEKHTLSKWIALFLIMFGVILLTGVYDVSAVALTPLALIAGLLSGLSYAVFIFGFKYAAYHGSAQSILVIAFSTLVIILGWISNTEQVIKVLNSSSFSLFAVLGVLGAGLSFILYITGLRYITPVSASLVAMVEPVTATLFSVAVLSETLTISQYMGMTIILLTVTIINAFAKN